jgi:hypothetical protein
MHFSAPPSLLLVALGAHGTFARAIPPNGYSAFYTIFDHAGCDVSSRGMRTVSDTEVGQCLNFTYPAMSVTLDSIKEGCSGKFHSPLNREVGETKVVIPLLNLWYL